jgi:hypothetical protein
VGRRSDARASGLVRKRKKRSLAARRVAIAGAPDRAAAEALYLELRRLAGSRGITVRALRIEPEAGAGPGAARSAPT